MFTDDSLQIWAAFELWLTKHQNLAHTLACSDHTAIMWREIQPSKAAPALSTQAPPIQMCWETVLLVTDFLQEMIASSENTASFLCPRGKPHRAKLFDFALGQSCNARIPQQWIQLRSEVRFSHLLNELEPWLGSNLDSKEKREQKKTTKKKLQGKKNTLEKKEKKGKGKEKEKEKEKKKTVFPERTLEYKWNPYTCPFSPWLDSCGYPRQWGERLRLLPSLFGVCLGFFFSEMSHQWSYY